MALDTPSRLKGIETFGASPHARLYQTLDTPSRLKGIETAPKIRTPDSS